MTEPCTLWDSSLRALMYVCVIIMGMMYTITPFISALLQLLLFSSFLFPLLFLSYLPMSPSLPPSPSPLLRDSYEICRQIRHKGRWWERDKERQRERESKRKRVMDRERERERSPQAGRSQSSEKENSSLEQASWAPPQSNETTVNTALQCGAAHWFYTTTPTVQQRVKYVESLHTSLCFTN